MNFSVENSSLIKIFESWAITDNPMNSTEDLLRWIHERNSESKVKISKVKYGYDGFWYYDPNYGGIKNRDNSFFQIKGLRKYEQSVPVYDQPIILQNEIGYLGIIGKVINGVLYFLMQAKIEPGNVNQIQISPTIQATKSNFMQAHGGKIPAYLEYFSHKHNYEIIADQIQSEQSSRFLGKRNRNIIIIVDDDIEILDTHRWMTLGQIKQLMHYDNLVNMDTRTVLSCIPFAMRNFSDAELSHINELFHNKALFNSAFQGDAGYSINKIFQYVNEVKMLDRSSIELVDLYQLLGWSMQDGEFKSENGEFKIIYCDIEIAGREVQKWSQPLLEAAGSSLFGLIFCIEHNKMQFLIHTKSEVGCFDKIEVGPSVQFEPVQYSAYTPVDRFFLEQYNCGKKGVKFEGFFSEEGGRFYQEQNKNVIMQVSRNDLPAILPDGYFWADFQTLNVLIQFNNCLNIQLRNLLSILDI